MLRFKERIPIILEHIDWYYFISYIGYANAYFNDLNYPKKLLTDDIIEKKVKEIAEVCWKKTIDIKEHWSKNPDLRLTQVLTNINIIDNHVPGPWYYIEEIDYFIKNKILKPEEFLFWDSHGKDGKQKVEYILLKDMTSEHIEACLKLQDTQNKFYKTMNKIYYKTMEKILRKRKLKKLEK